MSSQDQSEDNRDVALDELIESLAEYICSPPEFSAEAMHNARLCVLDSIGCALASFEHPACIAHLGPVVPGATLADGARVIGTGEQLEPIKAAFDNTTLIRWLDFNDTWLAAEWGHPSDNLGALLALADYRCRNSDFGGPVTMRELLCLAVAAHEIQGVLALENSFNRVGLDHVLLVRIACAGLAARLAGGSKDQVASALSNAWIDGSSLRIYRHAPNSSQRKSWAAGDAASRGVRLGLMATRCGMPMIKSALSAKQWGFGDVCFGGRLPQLARPLGCYVMENILFKVSYPAEFHAQTAAECAISLHEEFTKYRADLASIRLTTQESAVRIISKTGQLRNYADRDHCLQYIVAVGLLEGDLKAEHYADEYPRLAEIDELRELMTVEEDERYTRDYLDPDLRTIGNSVQLMYANGSTSPKISVEYPLGHRQRRDEAIPMLEQKFLAAAVPQLGAERAEELLALLRDENSDSLPVADLLDKCICA